MTTIDAVKPWRQPTHQAHWRQPSDEIGRRERLVEDMLRLGSAEYEQTDWAINSLQVIRPDLTVDELVEHVEQLLDLADRVHETEALHMPTGAFDCAVDEYIDALARFSAEPIAVAVDGAA